MVTITGYKSCLSQDGKEFFALTLQGELKIIQSENGNFYLTANKMSITTSFNGMKCQALIGRQLPGDVKKVPCESYQYVNKETGETYMLNWRYQYSPEENTQTMQSMQTVNSFMGLQQPYNPLQLEGNHHINYDIANSIGSTFAAEA